MSNQNTTRSPVHIWGHDGPFYGDDWPSRAEALRRIPSFQQTSISLGTSLYDLQHSGLSLELYSGDCETTPGVANCTAACSDPYFLFTPSNLRACIPIAVAALAVQNGTSAVDTTHPKTTDAIASWRVPDLQTFNATGMLANVAQCVAQPCGDSRSTYCEQGTPYIHTFADLANLSATMREYCRGLNAEVNADIAGPGVAISYFIQASLAVLFILSLGIAKLAGSGKSGERRRGKLVGLRLYDAVVTSLAEFHEAQTYFVLSLQIVTLINFNPQSSTGIVTYNSFADAIVSSNVAINLCTASVCVVLLVQCCLRLAKKRSLYTFFIVSAAAILPQVIVSINERLMPSVDDLWKRLQSDATLPSCGNRPSPMTYCSPDDTPYGGGTEDILGRVCRIATLMVWAGLFLDQLGFHIKRNVRLNGRFIDWFKQSAWFGFFACIYWLFLSCLFFLSLFFYFSLLVGLVFDAGIDDITKWNFGQLIALTVWAPTVAKYFLSLAFGIKMVIEERIPNDYMISKTERHTEEPEDTKRWIPKGLVRAALCGDFS